MDYSICGPIFCSDTMSVDPDDFVGQSVLVIGNGNAEFFKQLFY